MVGPKTKTGPRLLVTARPHGNPWIRGNSDDDSVRRLRPGQVAPPVRRRHPPAGPARPPVRGPGRGAGGGGPPPPGPPRGGGRIPPGGPPSPRPCRGWRGACAWGAARGATAGPPPLSPRPTPGGPDDGDHEQD